MDVPPISEVCSVASAFIENVHPLPSGDLLLSTIRSPGLLYTLDPTAAEPEPRQVTSFGDRITGLTGIVALSHDLFAVAGGLHTYFAFERGSMQLFIVSLEKRAIVDTIPVPDTATLNGMAALPFHPHIVLGADSIDGRIFSIDTHTRHVDIFLQHDALKPYNSNSSGLPPIGINGLRARGDHIYFTNSDQGTFSRIRVDGHGCPAGDVEVLARSPRATLIYDDFTFDAEGNAYVTVHRSSVVKITPDSTQTIIARGEGDPFLKDPTSAALANDGNSIYVVTGGDPRGSPPKGGQVVQIPT
jgi:sugar lactone lactonase YvrE